MPKFKPEVPTWLQPDQESVLESAPIKALRKVGGLLGGGDLIDSTMGAVGAPIEIPMPKIQRLFVGNSADDKWDIGEYLKKRARSPIIQQQINSRSVAIGSQDVARIASGMTPRIPDATSPFKNLRSQSTHAERRFAAEDLYRLSQEYLEDLGVRESDSVVLHRGGPIHKPDAWLTPTHIDKGRATWFERGLEMDTLDSVEDRLSGRAEPISSTFEVPRQSIRALVGILRAGDDFSQGEMLVPAGTLMQHRVRGTPTPTSMLQETPGFVEMRNPRSIPTGENKYTPTDNRVWVNQAVPRYLRRLAGEQKQGGGGR